MINSIPKLLTVQSLYKWLNSDSENPVIIDVRESMELEIANFPYMDIHIPMSEVTKEYVCSKINDHLDKELVILCHRGIRSFNFAQWLLENNFIDKVWNLENGIDGWSIHIDSKIPRY